MKMTVPRASALRPLLLAALTVMTTGAAPAGTGGAESIELSTPFGARTEWRFTATPGAAIPDPLGDPTDKAPGPIRLCISADGGRSCRPNLEGLLAGPDKDDLFSQPHFLNDVRIVRPRQDLPLLLIQVASLHSGDGDQRVATVALTYDRALDRFAPVYEKQTGRNNNQEIRYVEAGPLRGAIVSAEPTNDAPFGFWITIDRLGRGNRYGRVLRYRSATIYGDGNPLAVIDSEMPNIQQRLGMWRPGSRPPLPAGSCPKPRIVKQELWCIDRPGRG